MTTTKVIGKERQQIWFDLECKQSRQVVRQYLRNHHNGNSDTDRASYTQMRNEYKELLRQKKAQHRLSVLDTLQKSSSDPKTFWKTLKSFAPKMTVTNSIEKDQWYHHFYNVFSTFFENDSGIDDDEIDDVRGYDESGDSKNDDIAALECDITEGEVYEAIRMLKMERQQDQI